MKKAPAFLIIVLVLLALAGCTAGPNELSNSPDEEGKVAGFWLGLWHGIIASITFIVSLFSGKVHLDEVHNNGAWCNFGFILGMIVVLSGVGRGSARR
jgi:hypothetical protein